MGVDKASPKADGLRQMREARFYNRGTKRQIKSGALPDIGVIEQVAKKKTTRKPKES